MQVPLAEGLVPYRLREPLRSSLLWETPSGVKFKDVALVRWV
jgi:hypothetical protein